MTATIEQQIACITRELGMRRRVYPRWVENGKMTQAKADLEMAHMQAVHDTLTGLAAKDLLL